MATDKERLAELLRDKPAAGRAVPEHLTLSGILADLGAELKRQAAAGADELGAALFRHHDGFVMYPRHAEGHEAAAPPEQSPGREL